MRSIFFIVFLFFSSLNAGDFSYQISEKNLLVSTKEYQGESFTYDLNRIRIELNYEEKEWKFAFIGDNENTIGKKYIASSGYQALKDQEQNLPFDPYWYASEEKGNENRFSLYRAYIQGEFEKSTLRAGLQRIPLGVGRIWTPTDIFNPYNVLSIEPGQRSGVFGLNYTYYLSDLASFQLLTNIDKDKKIEKRGVRIKGFVLGVDMGASFVGSDDLRMVSAEFESNLFESGVEVRSEIGYFNYKNSDEYISGILGFEYGFEDTSVILSAEYHYNGAGEKEKSLYDFDIGSEQSWTPLAKNYIGGVLSFEVMPLLNASLTSVFNLDDHSRFGSFGVEYSLGDNTMLDFNANIYGGSCNSEFSFYEPLFFIGFEHYF